MLLALHVSRAPDTKPAVPLVAELDKSRDELTNAVCGRDSQIEPEGVQPREAP